jgi:hypothetical protein
MMVKGVRQLRNSDYGSPRILNVVERPGFSGLF